MFQRLTLTAFLIYICGFAAFAQKPGAGLPDTQPLTPAQQHEKDIRLYDPLDKSNPAAPPPDSPTNPGTPAASETTPATGDSAVRRDAPPPPLPGSVAASNDRMQGNSRRSGPQVVSGDPDAPVQEYSGPAVLSRSYTISRPVVSREVRWTPMLGISEIYDTGLTGGKLNPDGSLANAASFGNSYRWGLSGRHFWKHDQAGLDYTGYYNHYGSNSRYNGANQLLNADFGHEFSRRLTLNLTESGSILTQGYSLLNSSVVQGSSIANVDLAASPTTQILDLGIRQFTSMVDLTYRKSARLSFNAGGGFFAVQRTGLGTFGNTGYEAKADVNYRYTRRMTLGLYYSFIDYTFSQHIQISNINTTGVIFSYALGRSTQFRSRLGVSRAESQGLNTVTIDPTIAALIGRSTTIVDQYRLALFSDASAELVRDFGRNRTANLSYARGISPGNGVLMTSIQETEAGTFSMALLNRYTATAGAGHTKLSSASQTISQYGTNYVTFMLSRDFRHGLGANFQVDYRRFTLTNAPILHSQFRVSTGVTWGPTEGRLW
ncbi:MAG: hypothetical protein M3N54_11170 [Acidobacteriota bacterium]|nr:hypothetical protein [Acidobacteriota bacterium]